ncbi:MAG: hypothetical protein KDD61_13490 [Bdellovibrionales bacterium]|nr:hypothetical protein [Bdellovibrionales bacterium]
MRSLLSAIFSIVAILPSSASTKKKVEVHGHRGARAIYPENSLEGFLYAAGLSVDFVELDLHLTKDEKVVVTHDPTINNKRCKKSQKPLTEELKIYALTFKQLEDITCGDHPDHQGFPSRPSPAHIPLLESIVPEVLKLHPQAQFNIEIKYRESGQKEGLYPPRELLVSKVLDKVDQLGIWKQTVIQSFDQRVLLLVQSMAQSKFEAIRLSYLYQGEPKIGLKFCGSRCLVPDWKKAKEFLHKNQIPIFSPSFSHLDSVLYSSSFLKHIVKDKEKKFTIIPWTLNSKREWQRAVLHYEVDGIITDKPEQLITFLKEI